MADENDGTYTYKYTPDNEGKMSIAVILYNRFSILGTYYNTTDLSGAVILSNYSSSINYAWGSSDIIPGESTDVSSSYEAYLKAPITGTVNFHLFVDNYGYLEIDGNLVFDHMLSS